jgi:hypothetical protein
MLFRVFVVAAMAAAALPLSAQSTAAQTDLAASVERQLPALSETYKYLHRNPELSRHEEKPRLTRRPRCASWVIR